jgi:S-adenosylmethionine decarboxylase
MAGDEILVDAHGCDADRLRDAAVVRALLDEIVADLSLHVVGAPQVHAFPGPGGITALYLLSESHLACHTFPERGYASFNLYCCRPRAAFAWDERLAARLGARSVRVRRVRRGDDE